MAIEANPGARVGDYFLTKKLGEGGMAEVWLARRQSDAQLRALKFLNQHYQGIPEVEARFQNEGESTLVHPNIVRIFEVGQEAGSSFIAMEFVDGQDLENILNARRGPLTVAESVDIGTQILAGLGFAHASGIVHRDIKPSNVLVDRDGRAYVMDFGIAKVLRTGRMLTQVNSRLGTPDYMSPEQIRNPRDVDSRSDIYSFGCLFYELLTGWPPFDRGEGYETEHDIKTAHVTLPPTPPVERKAGLPAQLNDITLRCLAKAKEDRPQSCDDVIAALHAYRVSLLQPTQPIRANTAVEAPPKPGQGPDQRRETAVMPPGNAHGNAGIAGRSGTVVESPQAPPRPIHQPPPPQQPAHPLPQPPLPPPQQSQRPPQQQAPQHHAPQQPPGIPPGLRSNPSLPVRPQPAKAESGGLLSMFLITAGSLFLVVAAGGGGWVWYHKTHQDTTKQADNDSSEKKTVTDPEDSTTPDAGHPDGNQAGPSTPDAPKQQPSKRVSKVPGVSPNTDQPAISPIPLPKTYVPPSQPRSTPASPFSKPAYGTLVWTGDATAVNRHVTIVRSSGSAMQGGTVNGTMFPAGPIRVHVRPAGSAIVVPPAANTNYNTLDLFLPGSGQQTIYIDWTAAPNP